MKRWLRLSALITLLAAHIGRTFGADLVIGSFDDASGTNGWSWETWSVSGEINFDPADDAGGDAASGSMQLIANFTEKADYQQSVFTRQMSTPPKLPDFAKVALDIKLDADSMARAGGADYGHFEIILRVGSGWTWTSVSFDALNGDQWTHIEANIPTLTAPDDTLNAITLKIGDGNFVGPVKVHIDNIKLLARPAPVTVINAFNTDTELTTWYWETWSTAGAPEFDVATDAAGSAESGSLKLTASLENVAGYQQSVFSTTLTPPIDGVTYSKIALDLKVNAAQSTKRTGQSDYGTFEIILRNGPEWTWNSITNVALTNEDWTHIEAFLIPPSDAVHHLTLKLGQNGFGGPVVLNVDNIVVFENTNKTVTPPTLSIEKTKPGLNLTASQLQAQYQRQSIRTEGNQFGWVGRTAPVTYSIDIADYPDPSTYAGFQTHIFLLPVDGAPANADVDWSQPNLIFVDLIGQADGSVIGTFRYKTNLPAGNAMIYNANPANGPVGILGTVTNNGGAGRWSLTFSNDTQVTFTAPNGSSAQMELPAESAALFAGPLHAYFGVQPNQIANIGQSVVVNRIEIAGTETGLTDSFSDAVLDAAKWVVAAADARGIVPITSETPWTVAWTTPAAGFTLQSNGTVAPAGWKDVDVIPVPSASTLQAWLNRTNLPNGNSAFFRLIKR
jgi:hypothetical protein